MDLEMIEIEFEVRGKELLTAQEVLKRLHVRENTMVFAKSGSARYRIRMDDEMGKTAIGEMCRNLRSFVLCGVRKAPEAAFAQPAPASACYAFRGLDAAENGETMLMRRMFGHKR